MAQTNGRNRGCHSGCFQPSGMNKPAEFATETKSRRLQRESPVATFLELNAPAQIARSVRQGGKNNEFCYRHNPSNPQCRQRLANEPLIGDIQASLDNLPSSDQEAITHIWSFFSAANPTQRRLVLQGILTQCCFPQLSYIASCTRDLIRIDFISALPTEIGFNILSYLDASSLCKAAQVCRRWGELADDDVVWHRMCEQHIDRKCTKCGWGLPLLERKRLRASRLKIRQRAQRFSGQSPTGSFADLRPEADATGVDSLESMEIDRKRPQSPTEDNSLSAKRQCTSDPVLLNTKLPPTRPWKDVYCERQKIESNWRKGRYNCKVLKAHSDGVMCLQADDSIIASGSYDRKIKIWDLSTGEQIRELSGHASGVNAIQFDDVKLISGSMDKTLKIWNYRTGECISTLRGHNEGVLALHFDDTVLASGSADGAVKIWNFADGTCRTIRAHNGFVNSVRVHSACQVLFSGADDTTMKMWSLVDLACLRTFSGHVGQVQSICPTLLSVSEQDPYSTRQQKCPDQYFTSSLDGTVKWWDVKSGKCIKTLFGHVEGVWSLAADTLRVVTGAQDKTVKVWDRNEGRCVLSLTGHLGPVNCVTVGDSRIISGSDDGQIRIWDFSSGATGGDPASLLVALE